MNSTAKIILGLAFLLAPLLLTAQADVLASEDARFAAQTTRDTLSLIRLLADELVYIHSNALVETKADFIHSVGTGRIVYQRMTPEPARRVRALGRQAAIVDGIVHVTGQFQGNTFDMRLRYTAAYRRHKGAWRLVSWQSTRINN